MRWNISAHSTFFFSTSKTAKTKFHSFSFAYMFFFFFEMQGKFRIKTTFFFSLNTNCPKLCGNCALPQNFHIRKLGEITVFFADAIKTNRTVASSLRVRFRCPHWVSKKKLLTLPVPCILESCSKIKINVNLCRASKGFMKAFKPFIKPFEATQRSAKIKI